MEDLWNDLTNGGSNAEIVTPDNSGDNSQPDEGNSESAPDEDDSDTSTDNGMQGTSAEIKTEKEPVIY